MLTQRVQKMLQDEKVNCRTLFPYLPEERIDRTARRDVAEGLMDEHQYDVALQVLAPWRKKNDVQIDNIIDKAYVGRMEHAIETQDKKAVRFILQCAKKGFNVEDPVLEGVEHCGLTLDETSWKVLGEASLRYGHGALPEHYFVGSSTMYQDFTERCFRQAQDLDGLTRALSRRITLLHFLGGRGRLPEGIRGKKASYTDSFWGLENFIRTGIITRESSSLGTLNGVAFEGRGSQFMFSPDMHPVAKSLVYEHGSLDTFHDLIINISDREPAVIERRLVRSPTNYFGGITIDRLTALSDDSAEIEYHVGPSGNHKIRRLTYSQETGYSLGLTSDVLNE